MIKSICDNCPAREEYLDEFVMDELHDWLIEQMVEYVWKSNFIPEERDEDEDHHQKYDRIVKNKIANEKLNKLCTSYPEEFGLEEYEVDMKHEDIKDAWQYHFDAEWNNNYVMCPHGDFEKGTCIPSECPWHLEHTLEQQT